MPFMTVRLNKHLERERELELKTRIGNAIGLVPGKSEQSLLLTIEDGCRIYLRGDGEYAAACVELAVFGNESHDGYDRLTRELAQIFLDVAGVKSERFYIRYTDIPVWGVADTTFDRKDYW